MNPHSARPFPSFLMPAFNARELEQAASTIAVIDGDGAILWVNDAWKRFAKENGMVRQVDEYKSYYEGIAGPLRDFYRAEFANALATESVFMQEYECSNPQEHRRYHLRALPIASHGLILEHSCIAGHPHGRKLPRQAAIPDHYRGAGGMILQCSNCRRVRRPDTLAWDWIPSLIAQMDPQTSHGLCPSCVGYYWGRRRAKK